MHIVFNCLHHYYGGISGNGGSRTIILAAQALRELDHKVDIAACVDKYHWHPHPKTLKHIPKCDAVVSVSLPDNEITLKQAPKGAQKAIWLRAYPKWIMPSKAILEALGRFNGKNGLIIANAGWICDKLAKHGIHSKLCFAGMDSWKDRKLHCSNKTIVGCLFNKNHPTKRFEDFKQLSKLLGKDKFTFHAFGAHKKGPKWVDYYLSNPSHGQLEKFYSRCNAWFSPSTLEGFHNCPAESALCGSYLICCNRPSGGTGDFSNMETSYRYLSLEDAADHIRDFHDNPAKYQPKIQAMQTLLRVKIGNRRTRSMGVCSLMAHTVNSQRDAGQR